MIPNLEAAVINQTLEVKPDADGEERKLQADVVLELDMKLYQEEDHEVIMDVYTPFRQCMPKGRKEILESLLVRNFSRCRIADRIEVKETQGEDPSDLSQPGQNKNRQKSKSLKMEFWQKELYD